MSIGHVVTRGYGTGSFTGAIKEVATRGYIAGQEQTGSGSGVKRMKYVGTQEYGLKYDERDVREIIEIVLMALDREL